MFRKVLIANRGEIAVRVIRALRELNIRSVAVFSDADRAAMHVRMADEAEHIGASPSAESYLCIDRIVEAAKRRGAEAIHPGYGFLSENADFAAACVAAGIVFIGPAADAIAKLGSKTTARELAKNAGVPVLPGSVRAVNDATEARQTAHELGYPVLLKAAAGGGGKGMRLVRDEDSLDAAFRDAASEAGGSFRNSDIYVEKALIHPRHIEIQVFGDHHGNLIHLGERECSIQRRHQKVVEECPSPLVAAHPEMREAMGAAAIRVARAAGYTNAGTAEFLVDVDRNFYFLEMNTRLQVEHPVTELVTGLDLVHMQLRVAAGERLPKTQEEIQWRGSSIECRVYAEDPWNQFFPSPGRIEHLQTPAGPGVRLDSGAYPGWTVPIDYDPLLAKLAVWGENRDIAIARMLRALGEYSVTGIVTNLSFFRELLRDEEFARGGLHTGFIENFLARRAATTRADVGWGAIAARVAAIQSAKQKPEPRPQEGVISSWLLEGRKRMLR